jgi:membrane protease YdiL (CAAX protease family)
MDALGGRDMKHLKQHQRVLLPIIAISLLLIVFLQAVAAFWLTDTLSNKMIQDASIRLIIGMALVITLYYLGFVPFKKSSKPLLCVACIILPGLIIAINNFPWSAFLSGRTMLNEPQPLVYLFAIECLSIGFLEETVFRGIILVTLIQRLPQTKTGAFQAILIASALFGLIHFANLFSGASPMETLMQIGYSFLMGALWSVVYFATKNLLYPILLHATYNFFGLVLFRLGSVTNRFDLITILITAVMAIVASLFYFGVYRRLGQQELSNIISADTPHDTSES